MLTPWATLRRDLEADGIRPLWAEYVPNCAESLCPQFDGKRCRTLGFRPGDICEPAVVAMAEALNR